MASSLVFRLTHGQIRRPLLDICIDTLAEVIHKDEDKYGVKISCAIIATSDKSPPMILVCVVTPEFFSKHRDADNVTATGVKYPAIGHIADGKIHVKDEGQFKALFSTDGKRFQVAPKIHHGEDGKLFVRVKALPHSTEAREGEAEPMASLPSTDTTEIEDGGEQDEQGDGVVVAVASLILLSLHHPEHTALQTALQESITRTLVTNALQQDSRTNSLSSGETYSNQAGDQVKVTETSQTSEWVDEESSNASSSTVVQEGTAARQRKREKRRAKAKRQRQNRRARAAANDSGAEEGEKNATAQEDNASGSTATAATSEVVPEASTAAEKQPRPRATPEEIKQLEAEVIDRNSLPTDADLAGPHWIIIPGHCDYEAQLRWAKDNGVTIVPWKTTLEERQRIIENGGVRHYPGTE